LVNLIIEFFVCSDLTGQLQITYKRCFTFAAIATVALICEI